MACYPKQFYDSRMRLALLTIRCFRRFFVMVCSKCKIKGVGEAPIGIMFYQFLCKSVNFLNFKGDGHIKVASCTYYHFSFKEGKWGKRTGCVSPW